MGIQLSTRLCWHQRGDWGTSLHSTHSTCPALGGGRGSGNFGCTDTRGGEKVACWPVPPWTTLFGLWEGLEAQPPGPHRAHRCYPGREGGLPTSAASFSLLLSVATAQGGSSAPGRAPPIPGVGEQKASLIPAHCCWVKVQVQPPREWSIN